jgi:transcriptional regulator with XRE-family HTH domain
MPAASDPDFYRQFGRLVRQHRGAARLTQSGLATRFGADRSTIANLERGHQGLPLHRLVQLADVLGCQPAELLPARTMDVDSPEGDPFTRNILAELDRRSGVE